MRKTYWIREYIRWFCIKVFSKLTHRKIYGQSKYGKLSYELREEGNQIIRDYIMQNKPFCVCRFGFVEIDIMIKCQKDKMWKTNSFRNNQKVLNTFVSSMKSEIEGINQFNNIMCQATREADLLGIWSGIPMGDVLLTDLYNEGKQKLVHACAVEPYDFVQPWSSALEGKRVLVVSPFSAHVKNQYRENREKLFANQLVLPQFELITIDAIWFWDEGKDDRFSDWFEAFEFLYQQVQEKEFDIALLGCGPFGFPLAARIKQSGKQAIHMGGAIQLLFGIKGKRWDDNPGVANLYNEFWIRVGEEEAPSNAKVLDEGCYW